MIPWGTSIDQSVVGSNVVAVRWMALTWTSSKPLKHTLGECEGPLICFCIPALWRLESESQRLKRESWCMRTKRLMRQQYTHFILVTESLQFVGLIVGVSTEPLNEVLEVRPRGDIPVFFKQSESLICFSNRELTASLVYISVQTGTLAWTTKIGWGGNKPPTAL